MYDSRDSHRSAAAELSRLATQVDATWSREETIFAARGVADGASLVDLGAGPGYFAERALDRWPGAHATVVDPDTDLRLEAAAVLERFGDRAAVVDGALPRTGLPSRRFDVAFARYVFQHLEAPARAAEEMRRVLLPGGRAFVIDIDDDLGPVIDPPLPALARAAAGMEEQRQAHPGDRRIGRRLPGIMTAAGFVDVAVDAVVLHSSEIGLAPFLAQIDVDRLAPYVRAGRLPADTLERLRGEVDAWAARPDATALQVAVVVSGRRRARGQ